MNTLQSFKQHFTLKKTIFSVAIVSAFMLVAGAGAAINPGSIPYQGEDTPPASEPAFNVYNGAPGIVGNEADFVRVKSSDEGNSAYRNTVDTVCENGDMFDVWFYVHNGAGADQNNGGDGPSVARDVSVRVDLDNDVESDRFDLRGFISSSNVMNINDSATIDCGDKKFKLSYVADSAQAFLDLPNELVNLPAGIVENGTPIGTNGLDGMVWGCWDQRVWIGLKVVVEEVEEPELIPAACEALVFTELADRRLRIDDVTYALNDATLNNIVVDYGDGTTVTVQPGDFPLSAHTYDSHGTKNFSATLNTTFNGEAQAVTGECRGSVTYEQEVVTACKALIASRMTAAVGEEIVFNAEGMADGTEITAYVFTVNAVEVQNSDSNTFTLTGTEAGDYAVTATVVFANGDQKTNEDCVKSVTFVEEEEPVYICKEVKLVEVPDSDVRTYTVEVTTEQSNATVKDYIYNFGDDTDTLVSTNDKETYIYDEDLEGTITASVDVRFNVGDEVVTVVADDDCKDSVTFEKEVEEKCEVEGKEHLPKDDPECRTQVKGVKKKTVLPDTGAGSVAAAFAAVTTAGTVGHSLIIRKRQ